MFHGVINIYKEPGFTSHDVVAKLRGILRQKKIGHTGTLDPAAEGVLPVCLGKGTKLCDLLTDKRKTYQAVLLLGTETDTQDMTGTILSEKPTEQLTEPAVRGWKNRKICEIEMLPGMLITVIRRGAQTIVPKGQTVIQEGDTVVLGAEGFTDSQGILLKEILMTPDHRWCGKKIAEARFYKNTIIVMIKRGSQIIIPDGGTQILEGDRVVVYSQKLPQVEGRVKHESGPAVSAAVHK